MRSAYKRNAHDTKYRRIKSQKLQPTTYAVFREKSVIVLGLQLSLPQGQHDIPYILESNPHPFYSFRELKNQMRIRIACGLDSRSRDGFWKNDRAAVRAVRTI